MQVLKGILMTLSSQKHAFEEERARRLSWEAKQEARFSKRETQFEEKINLMQKEIDELRARVASNESRISEQLDPQTFTFTLPTDVDGGSGNAELPVKPDAPSNIDNPAPRSPLPSHTEFVQGSSSSPLVIHHVPVSQKRPRSPESVDVLPMKLRGRHHSQPRSVQVSG